MFDSKTFGAMTLVAALMSGTASMALTSDEVWADWQAAMVSAGATVSAATEVKDGDDLTLNGVTLAYSDGAKVTMAEVALVAEDDGSVSITPSDIAVTAQEGQTVTIGQEGLYVSVIEDEGGLGYGITADKLDVAFDGADAEAGSTMAVNVSFVDLEGRYERAADAGSVSLTATTVSYDVAQVDPAIGMDSNQTATLADLEMTSEMTIPAGVVLMALETPEAFVAAVKAGLALTGEIKQGASTSTITEKGATFPFAASIVSTSGVTGFEAGVDGLSVSGQAGGIGVTVPPGALPTEITASMDDMVFEFAMPVVATEEAGDYTYKVGLKNLVLADAGWALFDPSGALERGPADLDIDIGGTAKIDLLDLMASAEAETPPTAMPELLTMDIRSLGLKVAGAALSGSGAFTFDNAMVAMGGPPMPIGKASVRLEGGNKLLDGLIAMGVLSAEDAGGARLMMGMFGRPAGDDVLTSEIEAKEGGSIFVNGQQIQ